ncbi:hypothetical protein FB565_004173 [Actinoplanes lutulentus]|uniref:Uncharacterized protein n=1 Tax=Actinoplanes lutulentus TaxID=1287878 RepID=A0A327ZMP3_9ACTN|nr:hypothetical protein [Actinoplanes lutulentus]MBB2944444.1 hypothetical protein [Actinoplanes lutulentus]RAK42324.1 hypothetical protein B0I29_102149 [Actinoplanes lutulentus]
MDSPVAPALPTPDPVPPAKPTLPDISEYWPDPDRPPHRLGPPADHYELPGTEATRTGLGLADDAYPGSARPTLELHLHPRPRRGFRRTGVVVGALLALLALAGWLVLRDGEQETRLPAFEQPAALAPGNPPVVIGEPEPSQAVAVPDAATLEFVDGTTEVNVTIGTVPSGWFRVTSPDGSGVTPRAQLDGDTVKVFVEPTGPEGPARVDVLLSEDVTWSLRMRGGARVANFDLTRGKLDRIDLLGGTARTSIALPAADTAIPILMGGGVNTWRISTDGEVPVRAEFRKGAGTVSLYGKRDRGIAVGTTSTAGSGDDAVDITAESGIGTLTVTAR